MEELKQLSYIPSQFIFTNLPVKCPNKNQIIYKKEYGDKVKVSITMMGENGIPGGRYARLLMCLFTTEAVVRKEKKVILEYANIREVLKKIKLPSSRGKEIKEQLDRFAKCKVTIEIKYKEENKENKEKIKVEGVNNMLFIQNYIKITVRKRKTNEERIIIEFTTDFTEVAQNHAVPIDYDIYANIKSPLGNDLYSWFVYKNNGYIGQEGLFVSRRQLLEQFNKENQNEPQAYEWITQQIKTIKEKHYPGLNVNIHKDFSGITLYKSVQVIQSKDIRYIPIIYKD